MTATILFVTKHSKHTTTPPSDCLLQSWRVMLQHHNRKNLPHQTTSSVPTGLLYRSPHGIASWKAAQKEPEDYECDRVGKYAEYFKGNEILPILEIAKDVEPRILSLVVTDMKTKRITGLKKEAFEELLRTAGIPCQYFCRRSYAPRDILLPTVEQAVRTAATNITTKHFRLQPEYMGTRRVRVTICNVLAFLTGEVLESFLSAYGRG